MYNPTDRIVEACRGQCTNKQSQLIYQVAFYKTLSEHERTRFVKHEKFKVKSQVRRHGGTFAYR